MNVHTLPASRCPRCHRVVVPPARLCPDHPVTMEAATVSNLGEVVSFTTLHSPPEGFKAPLHIALVELDGGARLFCHGEETKGIRIGSSVGVESLDRVFYFSHMRGPGHLERAVKWRQLGGRRRRRSSGRRSKLDRRSRASACST